MEFSTFSFDIFQQFLSDSLKCVLLGCDDTFNDEGTLCSLSPPFLLLNHCPTFPGQTNAFCCRYGKASSFGRRGLLLCYGDTKMALVGKRAWPPFHRYRVTPAASSSRHIHSQQKREARDDIKREIKTSDSPPGETCVSFGFSALIIAQRKGHSLTFIIIFQSNELRQRFSRKKGGHRHYRYLNRKSPSSLFTLLLPKAADRGRVSTNSP